MFWTVALLAEGVDRNKGKAESGDSYYVALLAEGVDRNTVQTSSLFELLEIALLAEGVDRNDPSNRGDNFYPGRPPRGGRG